MTRRIPLPHPLDRRPFLTRDAKVMGVSAARLRSRGLEHPFRGTHIATETEPTLDERCAALQLRLPPRSRFSGITAAQLMGIPLPQRLERETAVHVAVPPPHRAPVGPNVRGHRFEASDHDAWMRRSLRVSSPARTWCELATDLTLVELVAAGDFLIHHRRRLVTEDQLAAAVAQWGRRRGRVLLDQAIGLLHDRSESVKESELRLVIVFAGIGGLEVNLPIRTSGGFHYRGDFVFPDRKVIVEYQSDLHRDPESFRRDMTRISRLEADGWYVMQVNADDLRNPAELVTRLRRVLARRSIVS